MSESERERQERRQGAKNPSWAVPAITRIAEEIGRNRIVVPDIGKYYSQQYAGMMEQIARSVKVSAMPKFEVSDLNIPALKLDYAALFPDFAEMQKTLLEGLRPSLAAIQSLQHSQFANLIENARAAARAGLPPNWRDENITIPDDLDQLLLDEGLALAWVPPAPIIKKLFEAATAQDRRGILGSQWKGITRACISELEGVQTASLAEYVDFARTAARTLLRDNPRPAQALSANLLDTILRENFDNESRNTITGQKARIDIDDYPFRVAIVLGGIWGSFGQFWPDNGDPVPRKFTRHGSAHGVSRRQYSRINSVIAIMHVVSLLKLLETDLAES
jgi:hypothetical protein